MSILSIIQSVVAVLLIVSIMLQQRGTALGSAIGGGGDSGGFHSTRRGVEKKLLWITIVLGFLFVALAIVNLII